MQRAVKCDKCKNQFIQKWINRERTWSKINEISYWTEGKGWNDYQFFCRSCLKKWFELERESFDQLVNSESKRKIFFSYRGTRNFR